MSHATVENIRSYTVTEAVMGYKRGIPKWHVISELPIGTKITWSNLSPSVSVLPVQSGMKPFDFSFPEYKDLAKVQLPNLSPKENPTDFRVWSLFLLAVAKEYKKRVSLNNYTVSENRVNARGKRLANWKPNENILYPSDSNPLAEIFIIRPEPYNEAGREYMRVIEERAKSGSPDFSKRKSDSEGIE